ncbi:PIG-H family GPI synthesis protein [Aspergillus saccharolyticus JOP 1030-1]|uniref:Phosphatidylinositol N-acetylglucosaminyltransferase n=1 Tax=Aspergillus saccharolyticus JOP 1030-1 TaxID=1450539 RepID=A0A318Z037_9EURO|nr:phosphatidylinositol N-acetylglucosaminyltransferase [Aspergillus saccharolyticus JOP 1030-1]PYH40249.1 phosphatidylinositol N-acetylglucosaminyltransferase [Aspergillus saccharolyticus JOP 1030-1]
MPGRLILRRPSPTTVSFTVSNASRHASTPAKVLFYLQILLRVLSFFSVLLLDVAKLRYSPYIREARLIPWSAVWSTPLGAFLCRYADRYSYPVVALASAIVMYGVFRKGYTEESLLVIRGLGIQTSTSSNTYFSKASTRFIPTTQIQDIVIHEAFKGFEVRFYLAVIVEGETEVVVVFPKLLPNRQILEEVWRGSRRCLYDSKS